MTATRGHPSGRGNRRRHHDSSQRRSAQRQPTQCASATRMRQQRWRARLGAKGRVEGLAAADVQSVGYQTKATAVRFALTRWAARMRACGEPMHQWLQGWNSAVTATDMPAQTSPERCRVGGQRCVIEVTIVLPNCGAHHSVAASTDNFASYPQKPQPRATPANPSSTPHPRKHQQRAGGVSLASRCAPL